MHSLNHRKSRACNRHRQNSAKHLLSGLLISALLFLSISCPVFGADSIEETKQKPSLLEQVSGSTPPDQLYLGMYTLHFDDKSRRIRNWQQNLIAVQYKGLFLGTFDNSFYNRCWAAGISREVYSSPLSNDWDIEMGYKVGLIYGYEEDEAPFSSISPIIPLIELYTQTIFRKHFGIELMLTTSLSVSFFYRFPLYE